MNTYYGTGRFCSNFCSHAKSHSKDEREKTSKTIKDLWIGRYEKLYGKYDDNPSKCKFCGEVLPYEKRNRSSCS